MYGGCYMMSCIYNNMPDDDGLHFIIYTHDDDKKNKQ